MTGVWELLLWQTSTALLNPSMGNQAGAEQGAGGFLGIGLGCFPQAAFLELLLPLQSAFCAFFSWYLSPVDAPEALKG